MTRCTTISCVPVFALLALPSVALAQPALLDSIESPGGTATRTWGQEQVSTAKPARSAPPVAKAVAKPRKRKPLTWSVLNRGLFANGALVGHINKSAATSGMGTSLDIGYQFGIGIGIVGHMEYTYLFVPDSSVKGTYLNLGAGLRFALSFGGELNGSSEG